MKRLIHRVVVLAVLLSVLLVNTTYADITNARMTDTPGGAEMTQFPLGTSVVYFVFDYADMHEEEVQVVAYYGPPPALHDETKTYSGSGTASIAISPDGGAFLEGLYATNLYIGGYLAKTVLWEVTGDAGATPTPKPATSTATPLPPTPTLTPTPIPATLTPTPVPPTATPTSAPPTPTLAPGQPTRTPTPALPTPTPVLEQPYPTPMPSTPTLAPEQPTLTPTPTTALPIATTAEITLTPTPATVLPTVTPVPATSEAMSPSPTPTTALPTLITALTPMSTSVTTATSDTTGGAGKFLAVVSYFGVAVALVFLALFLWQKRSS